MSATLRYFSPAEAARRVGVSVKALRVYEARGLVAPRRTGAGWRAYGPDQIERLHTILALKRLGFPLARISTLLAGRSHALDQMLALQEEALTANRALIDDALNRVRAARARLTAGEMLSIDDLATLAKETAVTDPKTWNTDFEPLVEKHFSPTDLDSLRGREGTWDPDAVAAQWAGVIADCRALITTGDPSTPEAMDLARRWDELLGAFTQGDQDMAAKAGAVWRDAMSDPAAAPRLPLTPEMFAFVGQARAARAVAGL